jgi:hypothetical protein
MERRSRAHGWLVLLTELTTEELLMFPRWLSWLVFLALGYVVFSASRVNTPLQPTKPIVPAITQENFPALAQATDMERWKRSIDPDYAAKMNCTLDKPKDAHALVFNVTETAAGAGAAATCGNSITIHLTVWGVNGDKAYDGDTPLALGSRELAVGLDNGLIGMKPGAERLLVLPPYALVRNAKAKPNAAALKALPANKLAVVSVKRLS